MKLSSLINYRNQLKLINLEQIKRGLDTDLDQVIFTVGNQPFDIGKNMTLLRTQKNQVADQLDNFQHLVSTICQQIDQMIYDIEKPYFAESYRLYENGFGNETRDDVRYRVPNLPESTVNFYRARICRYIGWQHPAMIIRPGVEPYINDMVSCDPLYLVDTKHDLLDAALDQFNEVYRNRLRLYTVDEHQPGPMLEKLPDSQFGLVLIYNYFNFRPLEIIRRYFEELIAKLKPGGILLLTFNDCDRDKAVMLVESKFCCYTPGYLVCQLARTVGFEIEFQWHDDGPATWLELKKPGRLETLRGGQALAKIIPK